MHLLLSRRRSIFTCHSVDGDDPLLSKFADIHAVDKFAISNRFSQGALVESPQFGTGDYRSLWVLVQSFSSFGLLIAAHPCRVQSKFKVIDFMSVTAGDHQLKPPAQRRHPFYRNLAVVG